MDNKSSVFISYRRKDKAFIERLDAALRADGRNVWIDWEDIPPGVLDFQDSIREGIDSSQAVLTVLTPDYLESEYCLMELDYAHKGNKRLVPLIYKAINPAQAPDSITHINWVYFTENDDFQTAFRKLQIALDTDYRHVKTHTDLLVRARQWEERGHDDSLLLRGNELSDAEDWLATSLTKSPHPSDLHTEYIVSSRRVATRRRRIITAITFVIGIIIALSLVSLYLRDVAADERDRAVAAQTEAERARAAAEVREQEANKARDQADLFRNAAIQERIEAEQSADEAEGLALASSSLVVLQDDDTDLAIALALAAQKVTSNLPTIPLEIERALATTAYEPGTRYTLTGHNGWVRAVAFIPNSSWVVSASNDGGLNIWDVGTGEFVRRLSRGHTKAIVSAAVSPDGRYIASGSEDQQVILWEVGTGEIIHRFSGHTGTIRSVMFNADGSQILSGAQDGTFRLWNTASGQLDRVGVPAGNVWVMDVAFAPDGSFFLSYNNGTFEHFDSATFTSLGLYRNPTAGNIYSLAVAASGDYLVTVGGDNLFIWNLADMSLRHTLQGHTDVVLSVDVSGNGDWVLSASSDESLRMWDIDTGEQVQQLAGHDDLVWSAMFEPTFGSPLPPTHAISGSEDFTLRYWDLTDGSEIFELGNDPSAEVMDINAFGDAITTTTLSPDRTQIVVGTTTGHLQILDSASGALLRELGGHTSEINAVAYSNEWILSAGKGDHLKLWNATTGELLRTLEEPNQDTPLSVAFIPNSPYAVAGYPEGLLVKWNLETGELIHTYEAGRAGHTTDVLAVAVSPDGQWLASGDQQSPTPLLILWEAQTDKFVRLMKGHNDFIRAVAFSPDNSTLISGGEDSSIIEWDVLTGQRLGSMEGHTGRVLTVAYSPNGERIISGSSDLTVRVWDTATNAELRRFEDDADDITGVGFVSDTIGLSASLDGTLSLWRVDRLPALVEWTQRNRFVRPLTENECMVYRTTCED